MPSSESITLDASARTAFRKKTEAAPVIHEFTNPQTAPNHALCRKAGGDTKLVFIMNVRTMSGRALQVSIARENHNGNSACREARTRLLCNKPMFISAVRFDA